MRLTEATPPPEAEAADDAPGGDAWQPRARRAGTAPADGAYDIALVVVHGMGAAYKSQILLEWAEPLLARMDWMARDRIYGAVDSDGVRLETSDLAGDAPIVGATVTFPKRRATTPDGDPIGPVERITKRIAIVEARWSDSFVPLSRSQIFRWAAPFMWRAVRRMLRLFWATLVMLPWYTLVEHALTPRRGLALLLKALTFLFDLVRVVVGFAVYLPLSAFVLAVAVVLTPVLPLVSPLLLIPALKKAAESVIDGIAESIGDVTAWKETPVRANAMRLVVRQAIERAKALVGDGDVHVFAHSQGAAVSTFTLFEEMDPNAYNVRQLTTVGAAVTLLGRDKWRGRSDVYKPVQNWITARKDQDRPVQWANHWAIWDPFSSGPIADDPRKARERWRASYFPRRTTGALGPEEHAVHNVSQPIFDHTYYYLNTLQVVEPTIRNLLGPDFPGPPPEVAYLENRLNVINKKSLGTNLLASVVIAALLPGITAVSAFFATVLVWLASPFALIGDLLNGAEPAPDATAGIGFLQADGMLTGWGWLVAGGLVAALLIWVNQVITGYVERTLLWDRCPLPVGWWLGLTSIPRLVYVTGAAVVVWFSVTQWWQIADPWRWWLGAAFVVVTLFCWLEARFAPAPVVVPARTAQEEVKRIVADAERPLSLSIARRSTAYSRTLGRRQELLVPEGWWAEAWARAFHGWPEKQAQAKATAGAS
ncbi:hypothetical protein BJ978_001659 [Agromyces terreus]|uniref:Alpha/beta hydrolase n=1 Tax=Agromyces terreus TaxID=424795 RepID=A0A9X2H1Q1_9MICO|nr:hypothetical protein [Agromyces terreus]MCP2370983.1 hypothetical protein [Agromyces terreus]